MYLGISLFISNAHVYGKKLKYCFKTEIRIYYIIGCISAGQRAEDERATHQLDNFKRSNDLLTINQKKLKTW
jgi:hypothetical protein